MLTLNCLFALIIQAKITSKKRTGNGKILIRLLSVIADCPETDITKERAIMQLFTDELNKAAAYKKIDRLTIDFISTGNRFPADKITLKEFENKIGMDRKPDWKQYRSYLAEMNSFCEEVLEQEKIPFLVSTLLELLKNDKSINYIFYGNEFILKDRLFGTVSHPKKICAEALLLGLLYQTIKKFTPADAGAVQLSDFVNPFVKIIGLGNRESPVFWDNCTILKELLNPDFQPSLKESLQVKAIPETDSNYPLEVRYNDKIILWRNIILSNQKHLFLYAPGGMGKSFLLQHQNGLFLSLSGYRNTVRTEIQSECSCWILIQILLKYHYHYAYPSYELCIACEGETATFRQISELIQLFSRKNTIPEYTVLLDGINEISPDFQDDFSQELARICENWHNVRIFLSSRTIPNQEVFHQFEKLEILGIPDAVRDDLLSEYPETAKDSHLLEILKSPLFLNYFLKSQDSAAVLHTRGEILKSCFENQIKHHEKPVQFVIKYALPFLAWNTLITFRRSDVSEAIRQAAELFLHHEQVYQDFLAPEGFRKYSVLKTIETTDFVEILIEKLGILTVTDNHLQFTHDYIHQYFAAEYILNAVHTVSQVNNQSVFEYFGLNDLWWTYLDTPYILLGEICGDYRNIPDKSGIFNYRRTELDTLLDMARIFHANQIADSVMQTMRFSRNCLICHADFSGLSLSGFLLSGLKFSDNGDYPSLFHNCRINFLSDTESRILCTDFSQDGKKLLLGMDDGHVILFDIRAGRVLKDYNIHAYLKYGEHFEAVRFLNDDNEFIAITQYIEFQIETESGNILHIQHKKNTLPCSGYAAAVSPDYQHFLIDDVLYSVTGERKKIQFPERYNHFRNCDFRDAVFLFNPDKNKEILRKSGAVIK